MKVFVKWVGFIKTAKYQTTGFYEFHQWPCFRNTVKVQGTLL